MTIRLGSVGKPGAEGREFLPILAQQDIAGNLVIVLRFGFFPVVVDPLVYLVWKPELPIGIAAVGAIGRREDRKVLLGLPGQDPPPFGRVIVMVLDLEHQGSGRLFVLPWLLGQ